MLQCEFAYDPNIVPTTSYHPPQFWFYVNGVDIAAVDLGGGQQGTLKGTIGTASSSNLFSTITNSALKPLGTGVLAAVGTKYFDIHYDPGLGQYLTGSNNNIGLNNAIFTSVQKGLNSALSTATSSLPGGVVNILSAIIGGKSGTGPQAVSLNLSTKISLQGSITSSFSFPSSPMPNYLPGSIKTDTEGNYYVQGYVPLYNKPLGVFNLSTTPTINRYILDNYVQMPYSGPHYYMYSQVDFSSFNIIWNPEFLKVASVRNINYDIIISNFDLTSDPPVHYPYYPYNKEYLYNGSFWGNLIVYESFRGGLPETILETGSYNEPAAPMIRISFNVVPKNGAPSFTIIKTFKAKYKNFFGETDYYNNIL